MNDLINTLSKKEQAIIFSALNLYQTYAETNLAESHTTNTNHIHRQPLSWLVKNIKEVKTKVFAESFTDDLEPLDYFLKEQKEITPTTEVAG